MKKSHIILCCLCAVITNLSAQVNIDKSINLSGSTTDAKISGIKDVSAAQDALSVEAFQKGSFVYGGTSAGTSTAYTVNLTPAISAYATGMVLYFKAHTANGAGPVTIDVNTKGTIAIKKNNLQDLAAGDITTNQVVCVVYDGASFNLIKHTEPLTYSPGTGISITGTSIANTGDLSATNELQTLTGGPATNEVNLSNSGGSITISGTGLTSVSRSGTTYTINSTGDGNSGGTVTGPGTANKLAFWNGTLSLTANNNLSVDNTNAWVGIGLAAPTGPLDVQGTVTQGIKYIKTGSKDARITLGDPTKSWSLASGWATAGDFSIIEEGASGNRLYIQQGGNVGIGTSTPGGPLEVNGRVSASSYKVSSTFGDLVNNSPWYGLGMSNITLTGQGSTAVQLAGFYGLTFVESGATRMVINSGKVGINNSAPAQALDVTGNINLTGSIVSRVYSASLASNTNYGTAEVNLINLSITAHGGNVVAMGKVKDETLFANCNRNFVRLYIDGVISDTWSFWTSNNAITEAGSVMWSGVLSAGAHTISLRAASESLVRMAYSGDTKLITYEF